MWTFKEYYVLEGHDQEGSSIDTDAYYSEYIYLCSYNGEWDLARKAMDDILYRAQLELYPEPLLVGNIFQHF